MTAMRITSSVKPGIVGASGGVTGCPVGMVVVGVGATGGVIGLSGGAVVVGTGGRVVVV